MPPGPSKRQRIIEAFTLRLRAIEIGAEFETNAGAAVFVNESPAFGEDDPLVAIAIGIGEDASTRSGENVILTLPIDVQVLAPAKYGEAWKQIEPVIADVKRAIERLDRKLGGLLQDYMQRGPTRTLERDDGSTTVGAGVLYLCPYVEPWGNP